MTIVWKRTNGRSSTGQQVADKYNI